MSLYREYLEAKSDLLSKDLAFKTAVSEWFDEHEDIMLLQPIDVEASLTMDHITITTTEKFKDYIQKFEDKFELKNIRIHHTEIIIPDDYERKDVWKFHFREKK